MKAVAPLQPSSEAGAWARFCAMESFPAFFPLAGRRVVIVGVTTAAELQAVVAAAASPPPDLDWDEMALEDPVALDGRWAAA